MEYFLQQKSFGSFAGVGLTAAIRSALGPETLLQMALRQVSDLGDVFEEVLQRLESRTSEAYVRRARELTRKTGHLHIPEPIRFQKIAAKLRILDKTETACKLVRFRFDKRVINLGSIDAGFIPSFPFGSRENDPFD